MLKSFFIFMLFCTKIFSEVTVVIEFAQAEGLIAILAKGQELYGEIIKGDLESQIASVKIYATKHADKNLDSFDIAKKMSEMAKRSPLGIYSISASLEF